MGVDTADPERARAAQKEHEPWRRMLPPTVVTVAGRVRRGCRCTSSTATRSRCGSSSRTAAPGGATRSTTGSSPATSTGAGSARRRSRCRRTCRSATTRCTRAAATARPRAHLIVTPAWLGLPSGRTGARSVGVRDPALQRPLRRQLGARRPHRPHRPRRVVGQRARAPTTCWSTRCTPPSRWRRWSRRRTCPARGGSSTRSTCASSGSPSTPRCPQHERDAVDQLVAQLPPWLTPQDPVDRDAAWTAKRAALRIVHAAPRSAGRELDFAAYRTREGDALTDFATWNVLAEDHGNDAREWPAELPPPRQPRGRSLRRASTRTGSTSSAGCSGSLDEQLQQAQAKADERRDAARRHARPRGRRAPRRRRRVAAAGRLRAGRPGRRAARPLQPARPGLEPAAVAAGPAGRARLPAVPRPDRRRAPARRRRPGRPRHRAVPALVDPDRPPGRTRAPTSATTTPR